MTHPLFRADVDMNIVNYDQLSPVTLR